MSEIVCVICFISSSYKQHYNTIVSEDRNPDHMFWFRDGMKTDVSRPTNTLVNTIPQQSKTVPIPPYCLKDLNPHNKSPPLTYWQYAHPRNDDCDIRQYSVRSWTNANVISTIGPTGAMARPTVRRSGFEFMNLPMSTLNF